MKPNEYKARALQYVEDVFTTMTCLHGAWNRDKILDEVERLLRNKRRTR
jgi:hypothetical protein